MYTLYVHPVPVHSVSVHPVCAPCMYTLYVHLYVPPVCTPCMYTLYVHPVCTTPFYESLKLSSYPEVGHFVRSIGNSGSLDLWISGSLDLWISWSLGLLIPWSRDLLISNLDNFKFEDKCSIPQIKLFTQCTSISRGN